MFQPMQSIQSLEFHVFEPQLYKQNLGSVKKTFGAHHIVDLKVLCLLLSKVSIDDNKIKKKKNCIFEPTVLKLLQYQFFQVLNLNF